MIAIKLAAICPCVLLAGAATAAWMPKTWEQSTVPPAAAAPAPYSQEPSGVITRRAVPAHMATASVAGSPVREKKQIVASRATQSTNDATLQASLDRVGN